MFKQKLYERICPEKKHITHTITEVKNCANIILGGLAYLIKASSLDSQNSGADKRNIEIFDNCLFSSDSDQIYIKMYDWSRSLISDTF